MFVLVAMVACCIVRVARIVGNADSREGKTGLSGIICSYAVLIIRNCLSRSLGSVEGVVSAAEPDDTRICSFVRPDTATVGQDLHLFQFQLPCFQSLLELSDGLIKTRFRSRVCHIDLHFSVLPPSRLHGVLPDLVYSVTHCETDQFR